MSTALQESDLNALAETGMMAAHYAQERPHEIALFSDRGSITFGALNDRANRLASALASGGIGSGDSVAIVSRNRTEFVEAYLACLRTGLRFTPVNPRLGAGEAEYIVRDSNARALVAADDAAAGLDPSSLRELVLKLTIGGERSGFEDYESVLARSSSAPPEHPQNGRVMFYTSGTTGKPKGVYRLKPIVYRPQGPGTLANYRRGDVNLLCGPAYHSASFYHDVALPIASGIPIVLMERFDPLRFLQLVASHRVTHTHMVPTMLHRLLALPLDVRGRYDVSSLRLVSHGGAPTPIAVKRAMLEWFGPILSEYYAATEGSAGIRISSEDWLRKPGSVGKASRDAVRIVDEAGADCSAGIVGSVFLRSGDASSRTAYHGNSEETARVLSADYFCVGDRGYVDSDGYLFLTGRTADRIISGGVNIDPQEVDNVLLQHPSVLECCCVGAPNDEWGEEVKAVVVADPAVVDRDRLSRELIEWVASQLAKYKTPRSMDFVSTLPHTESGKIQRNLLRAKYWSGKARAI
jgi:long-chain acyl-CoA synthetase